MIKKIMAIIIAILVLMIIFLGYPYLFSEEEKEYWEWEFKEVTVEGDNQIIFTQEMIDKFSDAETETVFASLNGIIEWLFWYNSDDGMWEFYDFSDQSGYLTEIYPGYTYSVEVNQDCTFKIEK